MGPSPPWPAAPRTSSPLPPYDTNGLESDYSAEVSYTVPLPTNNSPAIALTSPANGSAYVAPATISLAASVTANGHTITQVQFYNGRRCSAQ